MAKNIVNRYYLSISKKTVGKRKIVTLWELNKNLNFKVPRDGKNDFNYEIDFFSYEKIEEKLIFFDEKTPDIEIIKCLSLEHIMI